MVARTFQPEREVFTRADGVKPRAARLPEIDLLQLGLSCQEVELVEVSIRDEDAYHWDDLAPARPIARWLQPSLVSRKHQTLGAGRPCPARRRAARNAARLRNRLQHPPHLLHHLADLSSLR